MASLLQLAAQAQAMAGAHPCAALGHIWASVGGRRCPRNADGYNGRCSQTVYQCSRCEDYDYGEAGGPGHHECMVTGPCDSSCESSENGSAAHE